MDLLGEWREENCVIGDDEAATTGALYFHYDVWCTMNHTEPMKKQVFGRKLSSAGFEKTKIDGKRGFKGISVEGSVRSRGTTLRATETHSEVPESS